MWREVTEEDVLNALNDPEQSAYRIAAAASGQDVLAGIITAAVQHCRGYIADNRENQLAEGETLPERVIRAATHIIRVDMLTRLGIPVDDDRKSANKEAIRFFERVAEGKVQVEQPTGATDDSGPVQTITVLSTHERQATRENLSGL